VFLAVLFEMTDIGMKVSPIRARSQIRPVTLPHGEVSRLGKDDETLARILHVTGNERLGITAIYLNLIEEVALRGDEPDCTLDSLVEIDDLFAAVGSASASFNPL
jgi:hypothetical protein